MSPTTVASTPAVPGAPPTPLALTTLLEESWSILRTHPVVLLTPLVLLSLITGSDGDEGRAPADFAQFADDPLVWIPFFAVLGLIALAVGILLLIAYVWAGLATTRAALTLAGTTPPAQDLSLLALFRETRPILWRGLGTWLLALLFVVLGFVALVIPGFIVLSALVPLSALVVAENVGGTEAIRRTWRMTRGHRWTLFGAIFLGMLASIVIAIAVSWLPIVGEPLASAGAGAVQVFLIVLGVVFYRHKMQPA